MREANEPAGDDATIAHWSMAPPPTPIVESNPIVADRSTAVGQGGLFGEMHSLYEPSPAVDSLFYDSSRPDKRFVTSELSPPAAMFRLGFSGGAASFDAASLDGHDGALSFDPDFYGREFEFPSGFTIELFFRTDGDRSNEGLMEVLLQGDDEFRFALILNEGGPGNLRFAITDGLGSFPVVDTDNASGGGAGGGGASVNADLVALSASVTNAIVEAGAPLPVSFSVQHVGPDPIGALRGACYLSSDASFDGADVELASFTSAGLLTAATFASSGEVDVPISTAPGTWRLLLVADDDQRYAELDEANNVAVVPSTITGEEPTHPDFVVDSVSFGPSAVVAGGTIALVAIALALPLL